MAIQTSYSANAKNIEGRKLVSICFYSSAGITCRTYHTLSPSSVLLHRYKDELIDDAEFERTFTKYLETLDAKIVYGSLTNADPVALLCYEGLGKFCHRRIVAQWLEQKLGIEVPEIGLEYPALF